MRILYIGDIMGRPGRNVVKFVLPKLKEDKKIDVVIAQSENVTHGKGMSPEHMRELQQVGVDVFSGAHHSVERETLDNILNDPEEPVIRPANMSNGLPGRGFYLLKTDKGSVLVTSILGETFPRSFFKRHPLETVDEILKNNPADYVVVNFHGEYSSQKRIIGYYLDGRATLVAGDHWHVPSADAMILPKGTAHMTDVGMCGTVHTSLGIEMQGAIDRWKNPELRRSDIVDIAPYQFNAVIVETNNESNASSIEPINLILDHL